MSGTRKRRVIVAATCFADADAAIVIASSFAAHIKADLAGLLVEDERLSEVLQRSSAFAIVGPAGQSQSVTAGSMQRAFRRDAKDFEKKLSDVAEKRTLQSTFQSSSGELLSAIRDIAFADDLLFLGHQRVGADSREIILVADETLSESALIDLSIDIAANLNLPLSVLLKPSALGRPQNEQARAGRRENLSKQATHVMEASGNEGIGRYLERRSPTVVILACDVADEDIPGILEAARAPIVLPVTGERD